MPTIVIAALQLLGPTVESPFVHLRSGVDVLDRWWWSTMAYGWFGGVVAASGIAQSSWDDLVASVWRGIRPDLVFVFDEPFAADENNADGVLAGYRDLIASSEFATVRIERRSPADTERAIATELVARRLAKESGR